MGATYSFNAPPPNSHVVEIESGDCKGESCSGRIWDPLMPQPAQAQGWSAQRWSDFSNQVGTLVRSYQKDGFLALFLIGGILLSVAVVVVGPAIVGSRGGVMSVIHVPLIVLVLFIYFGVASAMKGNNQKIDESIQALCRSFSDGAVALQYETRFTGVCKPKGARTYRALYISAAGTASAGVAGMAIQPQMAQVMPQAMTQMMQVTCPPGMKDGDAVQISTPAGPMQVIIPIGISEGMAFQVQVEAPQPVVAVATAVPMMPPV